MRYKYLIYLITLLFLTQCKLFSSDDDKNDVTCLMEEITYSYNNYSDTYVFTYDEQNSIIREQAQGDEASWFSDYYYDDANIIRSESSDTDEVTQYSYYSWSSGQLEIENIFLPYMPDSEIIQGLLDSDNNLREYSVYLYDPNTESYDNQSVITGSLSWNEGNVIEIERTGGYSLSHKHIGTNNNNFRNNKTQYPSLNKNPKHSNTKNTDRLTIVADYDNNKNPFYYLGYSNTRLRFGVYLYTPTVLSKNNPTKITYTYGNNEPDVYTYEYTYNEHGYPETILEKIDGDSEYYSIWNLTYNCLE